MTLLQAGQIAGAILATIVILGVLVLVHEVGHFITARLAGIRVLEFGIGFPPRAKVLGRRGETDYTLNWLPIGGFVKMEGEDSSSDDPRAFSNAPLIKQLGVLVAGVTMNLIAAVVIFFFAAWLFNPQMSFEIAEVSAGGPAARAGLAAGQTVLTINGQEYGYLGGQAITEALRSHPGETVTLGVRDSNGTLKSVTVTLNDAAAIARGDGALGVRGGIRPTGATVPSDPITSTGVAVKETQTALGAVLGGLGDLGAGIVNNPTQAPSNVGGPIEITRQIGFALWDLGPVFLLIIAGLLSANLALINILPFPPLDGGRMVVLVAKRVMGARGVSNLEAATYLVGFALLMLFILWISYFDITRPQ